MGSRGRSIRLQIYFLVAVPLLALVGLWDARARFFKVLPRGTDAKLSDAREQGVRTGVAAELDGGLAHVGHRHSAFFHMLLGNRRPWSAGP